MTTTTTTNFKSERAAKAAVTKATKAYEAARAARCDLQHDRDRAIMPTADEALRLDAMEATYRVMPQGSDERADAFNVFCDAMNEIRDRPLKAAQTAEDAAWATMRALYDGAKAQGFYTRCYPLETSGTRELIALNMD